MSIGVINLNDNSMKRWRMMLLLFVVTTIGGYNATAQNELTGVINYHDNERYPMPNVTVDLYDIQENLISSTITNADGIFYFDKVPDAEVYIKPSSDIEPDGIDLEDAQEVLFYLVGFSELSEVQIEAGDVDNSGSITWDDFYLIIIDYLTYGQAFPAGDWQFEEVYIDFSSREEVDTTNLWGTAEGEVVVIWEPSGRSVGSVNTAFQEVDVQNINKEIKVDVSTDYPGIVSGFSMDLSYFPELIEIVDIQGPDDNLNFSIDKENGLIKLNWLDEKVGSGASTTGDQLITITLETKSFESTETGFSLLPNAMVLDDNGEQIGSFTITLPSINMNKMLEAEVMVSTYPNPVVDKLNFTLSLPKASYGSLYIYDISGRMVEKSENISFQDGYQTYSIETQSFNPGHYFYVFDLGGDAGYRAKGRFFKSE